MKFDFKEILKSPRLQFKKLRILLAWLGGIVLFLNLNISDESFLIGAPIAILGELVRVWASGHMERKGAKLATGGPFAYTRNPLYVGSFLMGLGIVILCGNPYFIAIFLLGFGFVYRGTVLKEEKDLEELFGDTYRDYCKAVPRFFLRLSPYPAREKTSFQPQFLLKHREHVTLMGLFLLLSGLYLWNYLNYEDEGVRGSDVVAAGTVLLMTAGLVLEWLFRALKRRKENPR